MSDISTIWYRDLGRGDWSFNPAQLLSDTVNVQPAVLFGIGDGAATQFQLRDGPACVNQPVNPILFRKDGQGNQKLYPTPRTNYIRNSTMAGAVVGSPGTRPTTWAGFAGTTNGITSSVVALGTDNGIPFIDFRFQGTANLSQGITYGFEQASQIFWPRGEVWTESVFCKLVSSALPLPQISLYLVERMGDGSFIGGTLGTFVPNPSKLERVSVTRTSTSDAVDSVQPMLHILVSTLQAYDFTLRFGMPQLEKGTVTTSGIPTTNAAVTLTDYSLSPTGKVTLALPPAPGAELTWSGSYIRNTFVDGGALQDGNDLATAILISIFTDREASADDVIPDGTADRRGWVGDEGEDYKIGSRIWLLSRAKQTTETLNRAFDYIAEALRWMLDDGVVAKFDITVEWTRPGLLGAKVVAYQRDGTSMALNFGWVWKGLN